MKKGYVGMVKLFFKKYGNKGWAFNYLRIKVMSRCLSAPDATSLHHRLQNHRQYLPARASEQGNVIGLVSMSSKKIVIERTRDLIYLKFVAKDFSPKIISHSAGENSGDSA